MCLSVWSIYGQRHWIINDCDLPLISPYVKLVDRPNVRRNTLYCKSLTVIINAQLPLVLIGMMPQLMRRNDYE